MEQPDLRMIDRCVETCAQAHQKLLAIADGMSEDELRAPSALAGWSRGHVLNHLRRNAIGFTNICTAALAGEQGMQYPGGMEQRNREIEEGAADPAPALVANLRASIYELEAMWFKGDGTMWTGSGVLANGAVLPVSEVPFRRMREVVVHTTDLGIGYSWQEWPDLYVRMEFDRQKMAWAASHPMGLTQIPDAAMALPEKQRVAWLLQRETVPGLPQGPGL